MMKVKRMMGRRGARSRVLGVAVWCLSAAAGASVREELLAAEELLQGGQVVEALEAYQNLQVDHPESAEAVLGTACAQYRAAEVALGQAKMKEARESFAAAQETFQRLFSTEDPWIRASAMFDYANAVAKTAKTFDPQKEYEGQVGALRQAVGAYEAVLTAYPDHVGAVKNLDHVRYILKKLLENPPEKPEQPPQATFQIQATTELPDKEAVVQENEVILQDKTPAAAPSDETANGNGGKNKRPEPTAKNTVVL
ncbi:MAG: hypothetical protein HYV26_24055 [Candidatus Hydrogenedentes bacterium]|nr:hypothetical protein [Candidatus Hydrogenedentota bacterium]